MKHLSPSELSGHLDGALTGRARAEADQHLASCADCRAALAALAAQDHRLAAKLTHDPGEAYFEAFADRVQQRIAGERPGIHAADEPRGGFGWFGTPRGLALAGGVAALIVGAGVVFMTARQPGIDAFRNREIGQRADQVEESARPASPSPSATMRDDRSASEPAPASPQAMSTPVPPPAASDLATDAPPANQGLATPEERRASLLRSEATGKATAPPTVGAAKPAETAQFGAEAAKRPAPQRARKVGRDGDSSPGFARAPAPAPSTPGTLVKPKATPLAGMPETKEKTAASLQRPPEAVPPPATRGGRSEEVRIGIDSERARITLPYERGRLCGRVTDDSGRPLVRASVAVADLGVTTTTGRDGRFCIDVAAGERTVVVMAVGFETARRFVTVGTGTTETDVTLRAVDVISSRAGVPREALDTLGAWPAAARDAARSALRSAERARRSRSAAEFDKAAEEWGKAVARARGTSHETIAREHLADARYQAWLLSPTPARAAAAIEALTSYIARAPHGASREEAARKVDRVRR